MHLYWTRIGAQIFGKDNDFQPPEVTIVNAPTLVPPQTLPVDQLEDSESGLTPIIHAGVDEVHMQIAALAIMRKWSRSCL